MKSKKRKRTQRIPLAIVGLVAIALVAFLYYFYYVPEPILTGTWAQSDSRELESADGKILCRTDTADSRQGTVYSRVYQYPDQSTFRSCKLEISRQSDRRFVVDSISVSAEQLEITSYDNETKEWNTETAKNRLELGYGMYYIRMDGKADLILCLPQAYKRHERQTVEALPDGTGMMQLNKTKNGWRIDLVAAPTDDAQEIDWFTLQSSGCLIDWDKMIAKTTWATYNMTHENRWLYDGYYYKSPSTYVPTGENYYYALPAAYITSRFVNVGDSYPAGKYLGISMLDIMRARQNEDGFFPTESESEWLSESYNIGAGFYDTRFNTDLMNIYLKADITFGVQDFWSILEKYADFYLWHAENRHDTVAGNGVEGWLVYDYGWSEDRKTHTSLNHQIAEMSLLEKLYQRTGDERYLQTENHMLDGLYATEQYWYKEDDNLEYGLLELQPEGEDYPYLTYNDLYQYNFLLRNRTGQFDPVISRLVESKLRWMKQNGVTGYIGTEEWRLWIIAGKVGAYLTGGVA